MTEKSEIDLLYEAAAFCGFNPAEGWRAEMSPRQLAALMAGGGWKSAHKQAYCVCKAMIDDGIKSGKLETRQVKPPAKLVCRDADDLSEYQCFAKPTFPLLDGLDRVRTVYYEKREQPTIHHIARDPCAAWLHAIGKPLSEHVRAWLGPAWKAKAPKVGTGGKADDWKATARAIGEQWMLAQEKRTNKRPTVMEIAAYVADELSTQDIRGPRGKYPDAETIKREALKGITGRKKGDNLRR